MNPFSWIRKKAAEAFVAGIADGAAALTPEGESPPQTPEELRALFAASLPKALPPKGDDEPKPKRGK
jgi:hypothetical protein